jgi:excisionase family DNA binding protein
MMRNELMTVQEAANLVGVSSSTLKRMCDNEAIPLLRTPGGHRRIDKLDLERLAARYGRGKMTDAKTTDRPGILSITVDQLLSRLLKGKAFEIAQLLSRSTSSPLDLISALEDCLVPALWKVGEMWRADQIDVYQEHLCTNTAITTIDILRQHLSIDTSSNFVAVGGSLTPNIESLPSKLVALSLELVGVQAVDLGGFLPPESLAKAAADYQANLIWVTHTHVTDVDTLLENHQTLKNQAPPGVRIIVGGGGISPTVRRSLSWCKFYETLSQMVRAEAPAI